MTIYLFLPYADICILVYFVRAHSRFVAHAAVLRLPKTQPKNRRVQIALSKYTNIHMSADY